MEKRNLMYVQNVGSGLHTSKALQITCFYTQGIAHTLVLFVITKRHTNNLSNGTFAPTIETNPSLAITAIIIVLVKTISLYTFAHTQGRNLFPVMCVRNLLRQASISNNIN